MIQERENGPSPARHSGVTRLLMADDQPDVLAALRLLLKGEGFEMKAVDSPDAVLASVEKEPFDLVLMDLNYSRDTTSGEEGLNVLNRLQKMDTAPGVIVMTAWGSIELAVEAMRRGAVDFILKPWDNGKLVSTLRQHAGAGSVRRAAVRPFRTVDMSIAHRVQQGLLPQRPVQSVTIEYAAQCIQAGAVGGDYYDFIDLGDGRTLLVLADVSGKGVAAALLMANLQATLRGKFRMLQEGTLADLVSDVNRLFHRSTQPEHFATVFLGVYDDRTQELEYANCGHPSPVVLRREGGVDYLYPTATVLGGFPDLRSTVARSRVRDGDLLAVFSDGVVEARDVHENQFGSQRVVEVLRAAESAPLAAMPGYVFDAVSEFSAYGQEDDVTLLVARGRSRLAVAA